MLGSTVLYKGEAGRDWPVVSLSSSAFLTVEGCGRGPSLRHMVYFRRQQFWTWEIEMEEEAKREE
jgi:hypothetical protein